MNSLVTKNIIHSLNNIKVETVQVYTFDEFCKINKIIKVDYLKIDTEGFDLDVLKGSAKMLKNQTVFISERLAYHFKSK